MDKYNLEERYKDFPSRIEGELYEGFGLGGSGDIAVPEGVQMKNVRVLGTDDDTQIISAELMVDDATDLPAADDITGYLLSGCVALVVHTGDIWAQDSEGEWYNQTNPETPVNTSVQSSTRDVRTTKSSLPTIPLDYKDEYEDDDDFDDDDMR